MINKKLVLLMLLLAAKAYATVTVTINVSNITGGNLPGSSIVIALQNCTTARIVGTGQIVPQNQTVYPHFGASTITLFDNTQISCSGQIVSYYSFSFIYQGVTTQIGSYNLPPGTYQLANLTPCTGTACYGPSQTAVVNSITELTPAIGAVIFNGPGVSQSGNIFTFSGTGVGVSSFNTRTGAIVPLVGDYSSFYDAIGAAATAQTNAQTFSANASNISSGTINAARVPTLNQSTTGNAATATLAANSSLLGGVALTGFCQTGGAGCPASGSGTVTSVSITTANGVSGSVATATTTPAITLTLGAITPTSVVSSGAISSGATPPTACGSANGCIALTEASTAGTPTASQAYIRADSTSHTFKSSINNSSETSLAQTIASGTSALGTSAIASATCATVVTTTATGVVSTDAISWNPNGSIKAVTGYVPSTSGGLTIAMYPGSGNVNTDVCNWTSASITPGAVTLNWRVAR